MTDIDPLLDQTLPPPRPRSQPPRQPSRTARPRRRHPARGARIAAVGLGATTMFGIVASMGITNALAAQAPAPGTVGDGLVSAPVVPIATRAPVTVASTTTQIPAPPVVTPAAPAAAPQILIPPTTAAPVAVQPQQQVRVVLPAPTPVAKTSGSH